MGLVVRREGSKPNGIIQGLAVAAAGAILIGSWVLAVV